MNSLINFRKSNFILAQSVIMLHSKNSLSRKNKRKTYKKVFQNIQKNKNKPEPRKTKSTSGLKVALFPS